MVLRGRAASPIRPGYLIKAVLEGKQPLITVGPEGPTEVTVSEACATDIHSTYQELIKRENALRPKYAQLRGMTSDSFGKLVRFAKLMGLIEEVREEPMLYPPPGGNLYHVQMVEARATAVISTRKILRLTADGRAEFRAWKDLCTAWREGWPVPTAFKPPVVEVPAPPRRPPKKVVWKPLKLAARPSVRQFRLLNNQLEVLEKAGVRLEDVDKEVGKLSVGVADWQVELDDMREEDISPEIRAKYDLWYRELTTVYEALADRDLPAAASALKRLIG